MQSSTHCFLTSTHSDFCVFFACAHPSAHNSDITLSLSLCFHFMPHWVFSSLPAQVPEHRHGCQGLVCHSHGPWVDVVDEGSELWLLCFLIWPPSHVTPQEVTTRPQRESVGCRPALSSASEVLIQPVGAKQPDRAHVRFPAPNPLAFLPACPLQSLTNKVQF